MKGKRRLGRSGAAALEFAIIGSAFVSLLMLATETGWQMAVDLALNYGARQASRFGTTGAAAPAGMVPAPTSRSDAINRLVISTTGGILLSSKLAVSEKAYASFAALGTSANTTGPGSASQVVQYSLSYTQPFLTPIPALILHAQAVVHHASVIVLNEPYPSS